MATPRRPSPDRILKAAMKLAAERSWRTVSLGDIADAAGASLAQLHDVFPSKSAILGALSDRIDAAMLAGGDAEILDEPPRDRLLDVLMRRLEALAEFKPAIGAICRDTLCDPFAALCAAPRLMRSMSWSLEAAGIDSAGLRGRLRAKGLAAVYLSALRVWLRDDSPDLGPTMAHLDRGLRRAERLALGLGLIGPAGREAA